MRCRHRPIRSCMSCTSRFSSEWKEDRSATLHRTVGTVAVLTLDNGERLTAEVRDFNDERDELVVDVVSGNRTHSNNSQRSRMIPIRRVVSFEPRPRAGQRWPYSDPCRDTSFSFARFVLMTTLHRGPRVREHACHVSYPRRPRSGQITCYLNRTYHLLTTLLWISVDKAAGQCENPRSKNFPTAA